MYWKTMTNTQISENKIHFLYWKNFPFKLLYKFKPKDQVATEDENNIVY